ncbi:hypothetical protein SDC9_62675 [bioreactor metagenome]|uniref:Uncharacterized protein n=1 Tax=bioreactor metagenome TaxID=1076179 RepID=A0A644XJZ2_9ZZZZ
MLRQVRQVAIPINGNRTGRVGKIALETRPSGLDRGEIPGHMNRLAIRVHDVAGRQFCGKVM